MSTSLNVSYQAISNWERGKSYPDISNIIMISDLYNISLDELIREDKNYKDMLLEKKVSGIVDTILNVIFFLCAVMILIYMIIENKLTSANSFYIILAILVIIHTSIDLLKLLPKKTCSLLTGNFGFKLIR
ncbi:helix-turn-helix transcriptional regulator [Weissella koreensis]|jgi:transcriptional regulator with XRE-family HTH domain|nr:MULTISPECIES: helix-turn-helix transcriptional regulator [Lactobacillaceae]ASR69685.1 transcriptional regulator [Leuconostoc mesenteroides]ASR69695.1 transcriptional regulator [Leuconostoc mesenteroides]MBA5938979.1 helix-turn-helix transcriptional regulator [Leuconostoc citreum]MBZ5968732.1 helix-turn-helix transcriptional regulator [Leuconostoc gasicomitatum]MBZ5983831.1 helix-turn-helix transcriptional regulator [Leuconostoc gasicomitatum]